MHLAKHGEHILQIVVIEIKHFRVLGVFLEGHGEGVGGVHGASGGGAEEDAYGSFACASCDAVVVVGGGEEDEGVDCDFGYV